ncbi:MAG: formate dehydrogenase subunit gamma [Gammaproteobacteria bacterium]|jgi:formate dehydrogenase subunit gamma
MNNKQQVRTPQSRLRYRKIALWSVALMVSLAMLLPLGGYLYIGMQDADAQAIEQTNPRANFWRAVRGGDNGYSSVPGAERGVLIQNGGNNWRQLRNGYVANYGGWALVLTLIAITVFFAFKRTIPIEGGRSGVRVKRWNAFERVLHWATAASFFVLTITGLSMLFGRVVLIPLMGPEGFAAWAGLAIEVHNKVGPVFGFLVVLMIVLWMRHNIPNATDFKWLKSGGGIVGNAHPDAGFANGGEKVWFWFICTAGLAVVASGLVLNFPNWGFVRSEMQVANLIHGVGSMAWVAMWFGHAYIGSIGSEGSLEGMTTGYVDENWAEQHHNLWVQELQGTNAQPQDGGSQGGPDGDTLVKGSPA